ncbi:hypothetical protein ACQ4M3_19210 [Leptolyngbya sp. AN03gr2]|uniref:hypothetical protein n=1 Tax=Leptolyngbya sp. AN03gr2 TaxID=3423364 RepID=UPI003D319A44
MFLLQVAAGIGVGFVSAIVPGFYLSGQILAFTLGAPAIIAQFGTLIVLGSLRELSAPTTSGNPDILSYSPGRVVGDLNRYILFKVLLTLSGIGIAIFLSWHGATRVPQGVGFVMVGMIGLFSGGWRAVSLLVGLGILISALSSLGFTGAVIGVVSGLGMALSGVEAEEVETDEIHPSFWFGGLVGGLVPGVSPAMVVSVLGGNYYSVLLGNALSEGISFGVFCFARATTKSSLTTFLAQRLRGEWVDSPGFVLILLISLAAAFCLVRLVSRAGLITHPILTFPVHWLTVGYFLTQNPFGVFAPVVGLGVALILFGVGSLMAPLVKQTPQLRPLFVSAPLILGF